MTSFSVEPGRDVNRGRSGRYSNLVRSLRVLLPLTAAALILIALMWPHMKLDAAFSSEDIPFSLEYLQNQELRMVSAKLVGTDENGRPFRMVADEAVQPDGLLGKVIFVNPQGQMKLEEGKLVTLQAKTGEYDRAVDLAKFSGTVIVTHEDGYRFTTDSAIVDIEAAKVFGDSPVSGEGPNGAINGSAFEILDEGKTCLLYTSPSPRD